MEGLIKGRWMHVVVATPGGQTGTPQVEGLQTTFQQPPHGPKHLLEAPEVYAFQVTSPWNRTGKKANRGRRFPEKTTDLQLLSCFSKAFQSNRRISFCVFSPQKEDEEVIVWWWRCGDTRWIRHQDTADR